MPMIAEDPAKLAAFLRELTELSRKHGLGLDGAPTVFVMEPEDQDRDYRCDDDSIMSFG